MDKSYFGNHIADNKGLPEPKEYICPICEIGIVNEKGECSECIRQELERELDQFENENL